jgi:hypothetical protein
MNSSLSSELSRAVPYLSLQIAAPYSKDDDNNVKKSAPLSITSFLMDEVTPRNEWFARSNPVLIKVENDLRETLEKEGAILKIATGIESFTTPQTLVNADRAYGNSGWLDSKKILDPFQPFMSLQEFKVSITGQGGLMSHKSGNLSIVLHDKSRLNEIAQLVAPSRFGYTRIAVTYGYSHPDGARFKSVDDKESNIIGKLIDTMKVTETFMVTNSSFSFDQGTVKINLDISMIGARSLEEIDIIEVGSSVGLKELRELIRELNDAVYNLKSRDEKNSMKSVTVPDFLMSPETISASILKNSKKIDELKKFRTALTNKNTDGLNQLLNTLLGSSNNTVGGALGAVLTTRVAELNEIINDLKSTPDPYLPSLSNSTHLVTLNSSPNGKPPSATPAKAASKKKAAVVNTAEAPAATAPAAPAAAAPAATAPAAPAAAAPAAAAPAAAAPAAKKIVPQNSVKYISFGKIVSYFIGKGLCNYYKNIGKPYEIQIFFYPFNQDAAGMQDYNISQFPILWTDFEMIIKEMYTNLGAMSVAKFMRSMIEYFINDLASPAYGFLNDAQRNKYARDPEKFGQRSIKEAEGKTNSNSNSEQKSYEEFLSEQKDARLKKIYSPSSNKDFPVQFRRPEISFDIQTSPLRNQFQESDNINHDEGIVVKIHIMDRTNTPLNSLSAVMQAAGSNRLVPKTIRQTRSSSSDSPFTSNHSLYNEKSLEFFLEKELLKKIDFQFDDTIKKQNEKVAAQKYDPKLLEAIKENYYLFDPSVSLERVKKVIQSTYPTFHYGNLASGILNVSVSSMNDSSLSTIMLVRNADESFGAESKRNTNVPMAIMPVELSAETLGCPFFSYAQFFYFDLGTNTNIDNVYSVTGIDHQVSEGKFSTSLKMIQLESYGIYRPLNDEMKKAALNAALLDVNLKKVSEVKSNPVAVQEEPDLFANTTT